MADILIVDDEPGIRRVIDLFLTSRGHHVVGVADGEEALRIASVSDFDVVVLDISLPGMDGLHTLRALRDRDPSLIFIIMTAYGSIRTAVEAIREGAFDFLTKPFDNEALSLAIDQATRMRRLGTEVQALRAELETRYGFSELIAISPAMTGVFRVMTRVAASNDTVLIVGESGTGKELTARAIHRRSRRSDGPFVTVNCAAVPTTLIEAEFFGVERGAYTDARESRPGKFELAHGGTLFLDEIGDLSFEAQAKLLRVLQDHEVSRLGSNRSIHVDVRVIAATNKSLLEEIQRGRFRDDLYYRLDVLTLALPPLRERREDLSVLIDHFLEVIAVQLNVAVPTVSAEARQLLVAYEWPGNVRELENALRRAMALAENSTLRAHDLPPRIQGDVPKDFPAAASRGTLAEAVAQAVARIERAMILNALAETHGNKTLTAEKLGVNRKTLFNKMKLHHLSAADEDLERGEEGS